MKYKSSIVCRAVAIIIMYFGCVTQTSAADKLVIGISPSLISTLTVVAEKQGYFKREGIDVELRNVGFGSNGVSEMLAGRIDVAESSTFALVSNSFSKNDFKILSTIAVFGNDNMIIARTDRKIKRVHDLKGKRVGVIKGAFAEYVLDLMLLGAGLNSSDVRIVRDSADNLPQRVGSGELDAACVFGLWIDKVSQALNANVTTLHDEKAFRVTVVLSAKSSRIARNPECFRKLLKCYIKAEEYMKKNPENARNILISHFRLDPSTAQKVWRLSRFRVSLDQTMIKDLENMAQWQIDSGIQKSRKIPDYLNIVPFQILEGVDPKRVTIVH
ncbi:MAG: ABC transporter substrate-binding protein [Desulfuromonadales bacterium]